MTKLKKTALMFFLTLLGALCYAHGVAEPENGKGEGTPKLTIIKSHHGSTDKSGSISASIDGHYLTVAFTENLGQVAIEITTDTGSTVSTIAMTTPNGYVFYIALAGDYIVTFTLPNGDVYYGEFTVTD